VEPRGRAIRVTVGVVNWQQEEPSDCGGRRQPSRGGTSRVTGDSHAWIREGLGVKFTGPNRRAIFFRVNTLRSAARPNGVPAAAGGSLGASGAKSGTTWIVSLHCERHDVPCCPFLALWVTPSGCHLQHRWSFGDDKLANRTTCTTVTNDAQPDVTHVAFARCPSSAAENASERTQTDQPGASMGSRSSGDQISRQSGAPPNTGAVVLAKEFKVSPSPRPLQITRGPASTQSSSPL
jgi:hypothetical protein